MKIENWELVIPSRETLAGDAARQYARRKALGLAGLLICCLAGGLGFAYWTTQCPVELQVERIDPSWMVDRSLIVTVRFLNPGSAGVHLDMHRVQAEAREAERWLKVQDVWAGDGWVPPNGKTVVLLQVPGDTEACRLRIDYSLPTFKERLIAWHYAHPLASKRLTSLLDQWLWPARSPGWTPPPRRWTGACLEVATPRQLGLEPDN